MPIKINSTGGGSVSIDVPSTGGTFTLTAPANNATIFTTDGGAITGNVAFTSNNISIGGQAVSSVTGFKNLIINGDFDIWQRGTSGTYLTSAYSVADRWIYINDGTAATGVTISRQAFTLGQTDVPGNPKYYLQLTNNNLSGAPSNYIRNQIEGVQTLAGQRGTYSFWARVTSGTAACTAGYQQEFGTGGSPSAGIYPVGQSFTMTTTWQKFSFTFDFPSIAGKTLGTDNNDKLNMAMYLPGTTGQVFQFSRVQLEAGDVATPFEKRPIAQELAMCQRHYYRMLPTTIGDCTLYGSGVCESSVIADAAMGSFPTTMRTTPTVTLGSGVLWYSPSSGGVATTIRTNRCSSTTASLYLNMSGATAGHGGVLYSGNNNPTYGWVEFVAEV